MLAHLHISNYTIVASLDMEFRAGMTVITGETGAGKSIMLGALGLCLGDRADPATIRAGCERAEITATFAITELPQARRWLQGRELAAQGECILRRVLTREGRSRAFINGNACNLQDCAQLGALLLDIHNQHAHQSLLRRATQRHLLDTYGACSADAAALERLAADWSRCRAELQQLSASRAAQSARAELLSYQLNELDDLQLTEEDLAALEAEQKLLANAEHILQSTRQALTLCETQEDTANAALQLLRDDALDGKTIGSARELLNSAAIQLQEARNDLRHHLDTVEIDPAKLADIERRLDNIYHMARKHKVQAAGLPALQQQLRAELDGLTGSDARLEQLAAELEQLRADYDKVARQLSAARARAAGTLQQQVQARLGELAMKQCRLEITLNPRTDDEPHPQGREQVEFLVSTNPGQPPRALAKIASGGELSRISLAIQVVSANANTIPSMVFDEVDAGIGGAVAESVGISLRALAATSQVLCITHLPQVAAQGHQHLRVIKPAGAEQPAVELSQLSEQQRVEEIARMLGGIAITEKTRAAAREILVTAGA